MPFCDPDQKRAYERAYHARPEAKARRSEYMAEWHKKNADKRAAAEERRRMDRRALTLIASARTRAKKRGLAFDLDQHVEDLQARIDRGRCEVTGYPFNLSGGRTFDSPSLDRINAAEGYTHGNVRVVLHMVNAAMGDWGAEKLREVMEAWLCR